jgi:hypothetical protein
VKIVGINSLLKLTKPQSLWFKIRTHTVRISKHKLTAYTVKRRDDEVTYSVKIIGRSSLLKL